MDAVPDPKRAIGNVWCYGKGQIILVDKIKKNPKLGKIKNKIARKGKAENKFVNKSSKTAGRKNQRFTEGSATTTYREARSNSRSELKKNMIHIKLTLLQKLKELADDSKDDEEIVSDLIIQADSDNRNKSSDHIITKSAIIPVVIC